MRIGLITGEYPPMQGGVGDFTRELALALARLGHELHVITRVGCEDDAATNPEKDNTVPRSPEIAQHPVASGWGWVSNRRVIDLARRLRVDVLNVQYQAAAYDLHPAINFSPLLMSLGKGPRPAVVVTFHDLKVPYLFPKAGCLRDWVVTLLARRSDAVIVTNRADELTLTSRGVGHVERIPIGSNIDPTPPNDFNRATWRTKLSIPSEVFLLGFFGFFNERKGVETLVRALAALDRAYHLLFIGGTVGSSDSTNTEYADYIDALIADLNLTQRVHYTGYVPEDEVSAAFAAIDLCILPYADGISFHHGTLMAALAHSQAIVSTRPTLELPELIHGENVWLIPPDDPEELVAAVLTLAADSERRQRLKRGADELAIHFQWDHIAERTADLFESLVNQS